MYQSERILTVGPQTIVYGAAYESIASAQWPYLFEANYIQQYSLLSSHQWSLPNRQQYGWEDYHFDLKQVMPSAPWRWVLKDYFLRRGLKYTPVYKQWRILSSLYKEGVPVAAPVAMRIVSGALFYYAQLLTETPCNEPLSKHNIDSEHHADVLYALGKALHALHQAGRYMPQWTPEHSLYCSQTGVTLLGAEASQVVPRTANFNALTGWQQEQMMRVKSALRLKLGHVSWDAFMQGYLL